MKPGVLKGYSKALKNVREKGKTTEYSYRPAFFEFLRGLFPKEYNVKIIHEPGKGDLRRSRLQDIHGDRNNRVY